MDAIDPNAYATGVDAASVNARAAYEEHDVAHARKRREFAAEALSAAKQRLQELEAAYKLGQRALDDAVQYDQLAAQQLETSLARLAEVRAPLHPIRKAPLEVLGLIFEHCWDPLPLSPLLSEKPIDVLRRQRQPFQLAAVCRRWRRASLSSPKAWSCIELHLDRIHKIHGKYWAAYLSCMLGRSASVLLHFRIMRSRSNLARDSDLIKPLVREMARCESLFISATRICDGNDTLVPFLVAPTPALWALHLMVPGDRAFLQQMAILPHAPKLTRMRTSFPFPHAQPQLPALTFVALHDPVTSDTEDDLSAALSICPNIYRLSLHNPSIGRPSGVPPTPPKVICNSVQLFIRHNSTSVDQIALSDRFTFPRLSRLCVYGPLKASAVRVHLVHSLLSDAAPELSDVSFFDLAMRDLEPFFLGLRSAAKLRILQLVRGSFDSHGLRQLRDALGTASLDGDWICPALTVLNLKECTFSKDCAMDDLAELVERRNRASARADDPRRPQRLLELQLPVDVDGAVMSSILELLEPPTS